MRYRFRGGSGVNFLLVLPLTAPEIVLGASLLTLFLEPHLVLLNVDFQLGFLTIVLAHIMFCVSYVALTVKARLRGFDWTLEDAAMDLGANPTRTFLRVTLPLIIPGILAAFLLSFALSIDDFIITYFVSGPSTTTFPVRIFGQSRTRDAAADQRPGLDDPVRQRRGHVRRKLVGDPAPEAARDVVTMPDIVNHWIDGKLWDAEPARVAEVFDPATGEVTRGSHSPARPRSTRPSPGRSARSREWSQTSLGRRVAVLFAFRELLEARKPELARIISAEHGKVVSDALGEIARGQEVVEFACGIPHLLKGGYSESVSTGTDVHSVRQPLGVVAGITPFNFPAMVPMWMYPVAIVCGNAFVLKPSERDPSASNWIAQLWSEAGLPAGVFTVLHGDKEAVDGVLAHPDVRAVSFVGSTPIARYVYETAAAHGKRVQALGGAKNHMVVLPDADLDAAADAAVSAGYGSAGERCMAISVVVAVGRVADELVDAIASRTRAVAVGAGTDDAAEMGPLVTGAHRDRVLGAVDAGVAAGAHLVVDGRDLAAAPRVLPRPVPLRPRHGRDVGVHRRDLRTRAVRGAGRHLRRSCRADLVQPLRERRGDLHA